MKPSAKPISSPGRTEKFPPPLMRFLRSNVGSKSRGRSRASPMMFMRKKNNAAAAIETQEPSSPKVTCIGQVRVRRSSTRNRRCSGAPTRRSRCNWIRAALFFPCFRRKIKPNSIFQRWVSFFQRGFRRKPKIRTNSPPRETPFHGRVEISNPETQVVAAVDGGEYDDEEEEPAKVLISSNSTPPKNALLLTRCRSAPYRSTSLASRFWGSPSRNEQNQEKEEEEQSTKPKNGRETVEIEKPTSQRASISDQDPSGGLEFEEDEEFVKNIGDSITERAIIKSEKTGEEEEEEGLGSSSRPLILTRCKSAPSRTAEKMNPEVGFWKKRRLGIHDSCSPNNS